MISLPEVEEPAPAPAPAQKAGSPVLASIGGSLFEPTPGRLHNTLGAAIDLLHRSARAAAQDPAVRLAALTPRLQTSDLKPAEQAELLSQLGALKEPALSQRLDTVDAALTAPAGAAQGRALRNVVIQNRIDAFMDKTTSSYTLPGGATVNAQPHFCMNGGHQHPPEHYQAQLKAQLGAQYTPKVAEAARMATYGRATPEQMRVVTQALIDNGALVGRPQTADEVRRLQWENGIGMDCAGYVQQAMAAAHGSTPKQLGLKDPMNENLGGLGSNKNFVKVSDPKDIQPGDVFLLGAPVPNDVGHRALVREARPFTAADAAGIDGGAALATSGHDVRRIEVDASWGAGPTGALTGGVQRRVWLYDATTKSWAEVRNKPHPLVGQMVLPDTKGPYDHPLDAIVRPKSAS